MVFEALVVDILNKFLGQYVENLDTSQLKIGIWGGDVVLNNLLLKENALSDLNLPVRVSWGRLGKLVLKIPWKNLYSAPVIADIEELLLVVIPNTEIKYDPAKEEKWQWEKKQSKLKEVEEAKKKELEKDLPKPDDTFVEKLVANIIKNVQITIKNIHIRYEDKTTNPNFPFCIGATMSSLFVETISKNSIPCLKSDDDEKALSFVYKVISLEGLAIYWNPESEQLSNLPTNELVQSLLDNIPTAKYKPENYKYIFGPIVASAYLRLNPKPESDGTNFKIPKVYINVTMEEISLALTRKQFKDMMLLLQTLQRLSTAQQYAKFRPYNTPVIGHAKEWWHFALNSVMEDIKRRKREWSWNHIKEHRCLCREYSDVFKTKLTSKKLPADVEKKIKNLEKILNVFNLVILREQAYFEVERTNLLAQTAKSQAGWFSGWFGYGQSKTEQTGSTEDIVTKLEKAMTPAEKSKLYKAIDYQESAVPADYPETFVATQLSFTLKEIGIKIYDDKYDHTPLILSASLGRTKAEFSQRPAAAAIRLDAFLGDFIVLGQAKNSKSVPEIVTSHCSESENLVSVLFETNPIDDLCDQRLHVEARPLKIIFDAETINRIQDIFQSANTEPVSSLVAATAASLPTFQEITSMGLQYAIEKRTRLELKVNIMSSYLLVPREGIYEPNKELIVVKLGKLSVITEESNVDKKDLNVRKMFQEGTDEKAIFSTFLSASYTNFKCQLTGVQVLMRLSNEDWQQALEEKTSKLRLLEPTDLTVIFKKSLVTDDARIPKIIIEGKLPSLSLNVSEERFVALATLLCSIPTSVADAEPNLTTTYSGSTWSVASMGATLENKMFHKRVKKNVEQEKLIDDFVQGIDLIINFEMSELHINVLKPADPVLRAVSTGDNKFIGLSVVKLEVGVTNKTFESNIVLKLGGIGLKQNYNGREVPVVSTRLVKDNNYLFTVELVTFDRKIPDFFTKRGGVVSRIKINMTPLDMVLHRDAILALIAFATAFQEQLDEARRSCALLHDVPRKMANIMEDEVLKPIEKKVVAKGKKFRKKKEQVEVIDLVIEATLDEIDFKLELENRPLAELSVKKGKVEMSKRKSYTQIDCKLRDVLILDLHSGTHYKKILTSLDEQTLFLQAIIYNSEYYGSSKSVDLSVKAEINRVRFVFLNRFLKNALDFSSAFQSEVEMLKEGASAAAERAKQNVMKAYENAAKLSLDVKITAPLVVVPMNSLSMEVLAIDMGTLTLKNEFVELNYVYESGASCRPLLDVMQFQLQNIKCTRAVLESKTMQPVIENLLLDPVSFDLTIKRNLSISWFRDLPDIEIAARMKLIHVTLSHQDYCFAVRVSNENFSEGQSSAPVSRPTSKRGKEDAAVREKHLALTEEKIDKDGNAVEGAPTPAVHTSVKFVFSMDSFIFDTLVGGDQLLKKRNSDTEKPGLAKFVLETISLKGRMFSDGSICTSILLLNCLLEDTRPGKEGRLTRLMERKADEMVPDAHSGPVRSMVDVTFQTKGLDTFVDVRVFKFYLILSMDFLSKLAAFFSVDTTAAPPPIPTQTKQTERKKSQTMGKTSKPQKIQAKKVVKEEPKNPPTFTINLRLEKPDIIVVENMDSIDTDALIFNTEMVMKYRLADNRQIISGTLNDIGIYSCCFDPAKRRQTTAQVIKPFTISLAGSTPEGQGLHLEICLTEIFIVVNPKTIELLKKCNDTLFADTTTEKKSLEVKDYSDLWELKKFNDDDYWFLRTEEAEDAFEALSRLSLTTSDKPFLEELCLISASSILITVEGLSSRKAVPLLWLEMSFQGQACNWSSQLTIESTLSLQMQYYNSGLASWEPLIEPVEVLRDKKYDFIPWELNLNIIFAADTGKVVSESEFDEIHPPKVSMTLSCTEKLELTVTKTCLEVVQNLAETFTSAVTRGTTGASADFPQFVLKNETGTLIELNLDKSLLEVYGPENKGYKMVQVEAGGEVELQNKLGRLSHINSMVLSSKSFSQHDAKNTCLFVKLPLLNDNILELPLNRTNKRYYPVPVNVPKVGQETWGLVSDVAILQNTNTITLRSILQVINHFEEPIDIHYMTAQGNEVEYVGTVEGQSSLNIPLYAVYNKTKELFFSVQGYSLSIHPFVWKDVQNELNFSMQLQCNPKNKEDTDPFFIKAIGEIEQIYYENTYRHTMASMLYNVHLQPTVEMANCLPVEVIVCWQGCAKEYTLQPGNKFQIPHAEPGASTIKLTIENYLEQDWSCKEVIPADPPEFSIWSFTSTSGGVETELNLGLHCATKRSSLVLTIYCPFLMVNKTRRSLSYKFDDGSAVIYHRESYKEPIMFSPSVKKFFSKKKATLKVDKAEWSDKFPIDVAGSGGSVECEDNSYNITYKVSVTITLTFNSLTRMVVFTPYYVFLNKTSFDIECQESDLPDTNWIKVEPGRCVPFWPRSQAKEKTIHVRPYGSSSMSPDFSYDSTDSCLLRIKGQYGGIFVDVQATNSGNFITFYPYETGQAPALIINHSRTTLRLYERGTREIMSLEPSRMFLFAWRKPQGERKIAWAGDKNKEYTVTLQEDEAGQALLNAKTNESVRYVSFLDGTQRILLFTDDKTLGTGPLNRENNSDTEIQLQIHGIGISLVNNINQTELLYVGVVSSKIVWETRKTYSSRFKPVNMKDNFAFEQAYRKYKDLCDSAPDADPVVVIDNKIQINFETMEILQPNKRKLRRVFEPGLWAAYRVTEDQITLHAKINKIQIDNQLHDCIFPVVLSPVPPPKTVAASEGPKPFFELSILQIVAGQSRVRQYKYFKLLIQEFHIKVDIGFLHHIGQFLSAEEVSDEVHKKYFMKDLEYAHKPLESHVSVISTNEQKNFYDLVHFSPLKIHFSFSLAGNIESNVLPPALSVMLQSLGVTLTDLHDVVFRLSYFERKCVFLTNSQLQNEMISHYYGQAIRQAYVLLLGLDVIGNPYGLVIGIGKGVEAFFYEPVQGIIQGPADFAQGVALGCKSLFGSTVGGTAGAISRITGTLGKGLAVLSLDKEYQRQRMEQQNRRTDNVAASMAQGGKGLVMGVYEGVTGVVMKPLSGAKEEGVGGFFKGVGKGMMGLVTRPVTGVVDFASTSLNAVKRATEQSAESQRLRPPRFFQDDKLVLPYKRHEAAGNSILYDIDKRKYCNTDRYEYHTELKGKEIILLTDKRMIIAEYSDVFGTWTVHLTLTWVDMPAPPQAHHKGIIISMAKKKGNVFSSSKETKVILVDNPDSRELLLKKMEELYEIETKNRI